MVNKVMICDDHHVCCVGLKSALEQIFEPSSLSFDFAYSGQEALSLFDQQVYDTVFMDVKLPDISGLDVIRNLEYKLLGKKVIVFTNCNEYRSIIDLKSLMDRFPISAVLQKTFKLERLSEVFQHINTNTTPFIDMDSSALLEKDTSVSLTPRENEIVELICQGLTTKEIAEKLGCSSETIKTHRTRLLYKTKVRNVAELSAWYLNRYGKLDGRA